jgi:hypothetical protein
MPPDEPRPPIPAPQGQHKASGNLTPALVSLRRLSHSGACLTPRWVAPLYPLLGLCLRPWIVYVAWLLPSRSASSRWDVAWVGVDAGSSAALAATGWAARRHAWWVEAA